MTRTHSTIAAAIAAATLAMPVGAQSQIGSATQPNGGPPPAPKVFYACYAPLTGVVYRIKESGLLTKCFHSTHVEFSWGDGLGTLQGGDAIGGDLAATFASPRVVGLQGRPISANAPESGQLLAFDGTSWAPAAPPASITAHGALTGLENDDHPQYLRADGSRPLIGALPAGGFKITGLASGAAAGEAVEHGQFTTAVSQTAAAATAYTDGRVSEVAQLVSQAVKHGDAASGDLAGVYPNPTVSGLQGRAVSSTAPAAGQLLGFDGTTWGPMTPTAGGGTTMPCNNGCVNNASLGPGAVTGDNVLDGSMVRSVNGVTDQVTLAAGANVSITRSGQTLTIGATGSGAAVSGYETRRHWNLIEPLAEFTTHVECPTGKRAIGGGASGSDGVAVVWSSPRVHNPNSQLHPEYAFGWNARVRNNNLPKFDPLGMLHVSDVFNVYVICANVAP